MRCENVVSEQTMTSLVTHKSRQHLICDNRQQITSS